VLANGQLFRNVELSICSPTAAVLRAPPLLNMHLDQIEMLPIPVPIEDSSIDLPNFSKRPEIAEHKYFVDRFAYFSWNTGCIDCSLVEPNKLIGNNGRNQFSRPSTKYLVERQAKQVAAIDQYQGWSICVAKDELGETNGEIYAAFGVDEVLIERLDLKDEGFFRSFFEPDSNKSRKRDRALQAYEGRFPNGHEADGLTIKEATNDVSEDLGAIISVDSLRRALGKKR
jgi:hypothetical protein